MKLSQVIIGIGAAAALGLLVWYLYMQESPNYERTQTRGLPTGLSTGKGGKTVKPKTPKTDVNKAATKAKPKPAPKPTEPPAKTSAPTGSGAK